MNDADAEILQRTVPSGSVTAAGELDVLRAIVDAVPHFMLLLDQDRNIVRLFNATPEALAGYRADDIEGNNLKVYAGDPASPFYEASVQMYEAFDEVVETGAPVRFEYMVLETRFEATISRITEQRMLIQVRDITSIVRTQREQERRRRNEISVALTAGGLTSWSYDVATQMLSSSHNNNVIGPQMSRQELLERVAPRDREGVVRMFDDIITKRVGRAELTCQVMNGEGVMQWSNVHAVPHEYTSDGQVSVIIGSQKDVTQEYELAREAENNRIKLELALMAGDLIPWEYCVDGREFVFSALQQGCVESRRITERQMLRMLHPDDVPVYERNIRKLIGGEVHKAQYTLRYADGQDGYCWVSVDAAAFRHPGGDRVESVIGLAKNISASIETTNELIRLRNRAEESNRLKSAFIANMSHEIRTPLNAIVGFSNLLATSEDPEERSHYMELVERNNNLLLNLISDILDLAKIESGKMEFSFTTFGVSDFLNRLVSTVQLKVQNGVGVFIDDECPEAQLVCDAARLAQVMGNFLSNAAKFTAVGEIRIGCRREGEGFLFWVKDTGMGIPPQQIDSVFDRFVQLNSYVQGTGLGLSICKTIVELLEGTIGVKSEVGEGSMFWCTVPNRIPAAFAGESE